MAAAAVAFVVVEEEVRDSSLRMTREAIIASPMCGRTVNAAVCVSLRLRLRLRASRGKERDGGNLRVCLQASAEEGSRNEECLQSGRARRERSALLRTRGREKQVLQGAQLAGVQRFGGGGKERPRRGR